MCNNQNVPSVTLQTAILLQVKEFAEKNTKFSAHDITAALRSKCNSGQMEIPEVEDLSGADSHRFNIQHNAVRTLFNEMRDNGVFDAEYTIRKQFNGMFFEYIADVVNKTSTPSVTPAATPANPPFVPAPATFVAPIPTSTTGVLDNILKDRVESYLENCANRNFRPSLKNVQSAIKRGNKSTGVSSAELLDYIQKDLGYKVTVGGDIKNTQIVTV